MALLIMRVVITTYSMWDLINPFTAEFLTHFTVLQKNHYIKSATAYNLGNISHRSELKQS